jgi:PIN domain nuclease of toxin-antitoxin system
MVNLDTHILADAIDDRLRPGEAELIRDEAWCVSDIVLWELGLLAREGRLRFDLDHPTFNRVLGRLTIMPITRDIAIALTRLDFRSDPADEIIAATSLVHGIPLLTRDMRILGSKVVPLAIR